jgi:hypothetical protein
MSLLRRSVLVGIVSCASLIFSSCSNEPPKTAPTTAAALPPVAVPAQAGAVEGRTENSDAFMWALFTQITAPISAQSGSSVEFERWASDADTFTSNPHWPSGLEPLKFHASVLALAKTGDLALAESRDLAPARRGGGARSLAVLKIDEPCAGSPPQSPPPPDGSAAGGFPTTGNPIPCIVEQVARNKTNYEDIVNNRLNTQAGRAAAYKAGKDVEMRPDAVAIKGDWVPLPMLLQWIPALGNLDNVRRQYYTTTSSATEYALVAMHVASRQNPNWVWGTFEHQMNPGRCDYMGCFDTFGAQVAAVSPNLSEYNAGYGACEKTPALKALMQKANLSPVWQNYCLKSTEVDFTAPDGTPYVLGSSVIEGIMGNGTVAASSCISCHKYASFDATGNPAKAVTKILPFNPTGKPILNVLAGSKTFAFNWGLVTQRK